MEVYERVVFSGSQYSDLLIQRIRDAQIEISISCYIFEHDTFGGKIFDLLREKAQTGVKVQICVDGFGSSNWLNHISENLPIKNIHIRVFHPLPWPFSRLRIDQLIRFDVLIQWIYHSNIRNHQKLIIFDHTSAIMGSRNINDESLHWRETSLFFKGPALQEANTLFKRIWQRSFSLNSKSKNFSNVIQKKMNYKFLFSNDSLALRKKRLDLVWHQIQQAQSSIYITTPYFLPRPKILKLLCKKSKSGVDVKILLPSQSDVPFSKWLAETRYNTMIRSHIEIYELNTEILHAKTILIDHWSLLGSSNFNRRSALRDLEIDYATSNKETIDTLNRKFLEDISNSQIIQLNPSSNPFKEKILNFFTQVFYSWF